MEKKTEEKQVTVLEKKDLLALELGKYKVGALVEMVSRRILSAENIELKAKEESTALRSEAAGLQEKVNLERNKFDHVKIEIGKKYGVDFNVVGYNENNGNLIFPQEQKE